LSAVKVSLRFFGGKVIYTTLNIDMDELIHELESLEKSTDFMSLLKVLEKIEQLLPSSNFVELLQLTHTYSILDHLEVIVKPSELPNLQALFLCVHGSAYPNIIKRIEWKDWIPYVDQHHVILLFQQILVQDEFHIDELDNFRDRVLPTLSAIVGRDDDLAKEAIQLMVLFHGQCCRKPQQYGELIPQLLNSELLPHRKPISLILIMCFNRADPLLQKCMVDLLHRLLKLNSEYFYTNDLAVLFDVTLRDVTRINDQDEQLRHAYMHLLPVVLACIPASSPGVDSLKKQLIEKLSSVKDSPLTPTTTNLLATRILSSIQ
jgi:hypothetical protein